MDMSEMISLDARSLRGTLARAEPMRRHTSWRTGGAADQVYVPADLADLAAFLAQLPTGEPVHFVGLGSNLLVRDGGVRATVIFTHGALGSLGVSPDGLVYAEAGVASPKVSRQAALHDLEGAEFLAGIPGTVGGALAMNAGCYGSETWQRVEKVLVMDRSGQCRERHPRDYDLGYRHCVRAGGASDAEWFVAAWLRFDRGDGQAARARIRQFLGRRIATQPLGQPNAGSVFRNPPGDHAARLIEASGLKGFAIGGAVVSPKHANFIVNSGTATAADIERLIEHIRTTVLLEHGVALEAEVRILGDDAT